ncbi:MAG: alpha/beta fold hydrolase [Myxococcota bacterium]
MNASPIEFDLRLPDLTLEHGGTVHPLTVRGWMWGPDSADFLRCRGVSFRAVSSSLEKTTPPSTEAMSSGERDVPTVLIVHALTGDAQAGGDSGWWSPLIGPGRAFDPTQIRVLCFNNLGSCYGTSGPGDEGFPEGPVTTWDQSRALLRALDRLALDRIALVTGGSLGGMITVALACLAPERFERMVPVAACKAASAWIIGFNHVQRRALELVGHSPEGLAVARQIAMLSYRSEPGLDDRQGRQRASSDANAPFRMQTYLDYQGQKFVGRFDPAAYVAMMDAMDSHDIERRPTCRDEGEQWTWPVTDMGIDRIRAHCMAIGIDTDQLFFPVHSETIVQELAERGRIAEYAIVHSRHGHDAFLIEWDQLDKIMRRALAMPAGRD